MVWRGITYNENYGKMLVDFCKKPKAFVSKKDKNTGLMVKVPGEYPTIQEFRVKNNIPRRTWNHRVKNYEELAEAVDLVKDMQEDMLIKNGLAGRWNAQVVSRVGMTDHDRTEKKEVTTKRGELTGDQKKKMFEEYMRNIEAKGEVVGDGVLLSTEENA